MPGPGQQVPHILVRPLEDGFDKAIVQVAHPPRHTALPGHPLTGRTEVDALDPAGDQYPVADHMPTLRRRRRGRCRVQAGGPRVSVMKVLVGLAR
jgi:hypothetical protein